MRNIRILYVCTDSEIKKVEDIATNVWNEHYTPIIEKDQIEYMITKFQSRDAIKKQMKYDGYKYCILNFKGTNVGYLAFKKEGKQLFLSKLYVEKEYRNNGIADLAIKHLMHVCDRDGLEKICLNVNKKNCESIEIYEKMGFVKTSEKVTDIGEGYVMDDYIMEKAV